jgi:hypothetical protein
MTRHGYNEREHHAMKYQTYGCFRDATLATIPAQVLT